ncbi:DUF4825 domain-containing protein [Paenibacillus sp.]|uniref:DUF4825 domain-containing protein n=1 Tax=Paenibacillus sp. TaxID=58172 RepID=UPI002811DCDD|nr:DUF4825 domain-containing protein [Paenibacillus sp.]
MNKGIFIILLLALFQAGIGCNSNPKEEDDLFRFKNSYVGDNGAVGNIARRLPGPGGEHLDGFELKTTEKPYGIILNYKNSETNQETMKNYEENALYNASIMLALVQNADWVTFRYAEQTYTVAREDLQRWYEQDLRDFESENELIQYIQKCLEDEDQVTRFFHSVPQ